MFDINYPLQAVSSIYAGLPVLTPVTVSATAFDIERANRCISAYCHYHEKISKLLQENKKSADEKNSISLSMILRGPSMMMMLATVTTTMMTTTLTMMTIRRRRRMMMTTMVVLVVVTMMAMTNI